MVADETPALQSVLCFQSKPGNLRSRIAMPRILLLNPPIHDFSAYDFWLKPYGLLRTAGFLRGRAEFALFDFLDRLDPNVPQTKRYRSDAWGRGEFYSEPAPRP